MAKKKVAPPQIENAKAIEPITQNGLSDAIGFGAGPFGGRGEQVEQTDTIFKNLRWYLASNFRQMLSQAYVEIGLVQTVVDVPVDDALRGGITLKSNQLDEEQLKELRLSMDRDSDIETAGQAAKWSRLFGGAGILILTDQDPELELDVSRIGQDEELEFRAVDMWELFWDKQNVEGYDASLQAQNFTYYDYYASKVHKSRVMRLKGRVAPSFIRPRLRGWGVSEVEVLVRSINQYLKSTDLGFEVLDEFKIDVYKIKNLVNTLMSPNGTQKVRERVQMANWQKNYQNAVVMDSEDDWDHKQLSFAGLAEAMTGIRMQVAADMRMPITKLFGTSVSGGFSTDQNDMENYNSMVESQVRNKLKYDLLRIAEIKCQKLFGFIPDDMELFFKPLRELTATDEETVKTQKFTRAFQAKQGGEISTEEFRDICNKGNLFDIELDTSAAAISLAEAESADTADGADGEPGANKADTRKPQATKNTVGTQEPDPTVPAPEPAATIDGAVTLVEQPPEAVHSLVSEESGESPFNRVAYEEDGGDDRWSLVAHPGTVEPSLWNKAKEASMKYYGIYNWSFIAWRYKKEGGVFLDSGPAVIFSNKKRGKK